MIEILKKIVTKRIKTLQKKGLSFGIDLPVNREVPLVLPDFDEGVLICEIKRGSPSEGRMNNIEEPAEWAGKYISAGAGAISILTEEDFFYGTLNDLIVIKNRYPDIPVLRKDFLLSEDEIDVSYRAGADLILLIVDVLLELDENKSISLLKRMKERAERFGMFPLIEVHNKKELDLVLPLNPKLVGINSRDLNTFKINRGYPYGLKEIMPSTTHVVYESGIRNSTDAFFVGSAGFDSMLIGTSIIKSGDIVDKINKIKNGFLNGKDRQGRFFNKLFHKIFIEKKLVVKICGITNIEDAEAAVEAGADVIGFILAESPRRISIEKAKEISSIMGDRALKVAVVVNENIEEAVNVVKEGWFDAVQFHGDISNDEASKYNIPWYKAVRVKEKCDFEKSYFCPFVLFDAFSREAYGGTGKQIDNKLLDYAKEKGIDLYLAGGITPDNVAEIVANYSPYMIDVSSGLEECPGKKDHKKIKLFFKILAEESKSFLLKTSIMRESL